MYILRKQIIQKNENFNQSCTAAAAAAAAKSLQSYPTLCDPMDCSLQGFSIHGILQARIMEWGAIAFSEIKQKRMEKSYLD